MHKCVNKTPGNIGHIEQMVDNFFPYSQKKLGFEEPVTIIFQSDEDNASKMLGKTAYYDPQAFEVVLYIDKRHPKDVLRSLSHELVHHAQNCRGDFTSDSATYEGYAQNDPHLRKMEREAYTKGNLIFRDFEDLIKTGKINIEIDFSDSGEPEMSLKEWKNNEINRKLMKKWGFLLEGTAKEREDEEGNRPSMAKDMDLDEEAQHPGQSCDEAHPGEGHPVEEAVYRDDELEDSSDELEEGPADWKAIAAAPDDPTDVPTATGVEMTRTKKRGEWGQKVRGKSGVQGKRDKPGAAGSRNIMTMGEGGDEDEASLEEGDPLMKLTPKGHRDTETSSDKRLDYEKDPAAHMTTAQALELGLSPDTVRSAVDWDPTAEHPDDRRDTRQASRGGHQVGLGTARRRWRKAFAGQFSEGRISIKEAKEITRRIMERIKKESK